MVTIIQREVIDNVGRGKEKSAEIVEKLNILDDYLTSRLEETKQDLQLMSSYISEIESRFKSGDLSVQNYSVESIKDLTAYKEMMASIYGENSIINEVEEIFERMLRGESLTEVERDQLYKYIQTLMIDDNTRKDMENLISMIGEDSDRLINHLNESVLSTESALNNQITTVEAFIYTGNTGPYENNLSVQDIGKLKSYLITLKNYKRAIEELKEEVDWTIVAGPNEPLLARVTKLEHWQESENYTMNFESDIAISTYRGDMTREEFLNSENLLLIRENNSKTTYYMGEDASIGLQGDKLKELENKDATFIQDSIGKELTEVIIGNLGKKGPVVNHLITAFEMYEEDQQNKQDIEIGLAHKAAMTLDMEIEIIERHVPYKGTEYRIGVLPTDLTYDILDNWKRVHEKYPDLPIPLEEIEEHDWYRIANKVTEHQQEIRENFSDEVYRDIFGGNN